MMLECSGADGDAAATKKDAKRPEDDGNRTLWVRNMSRHVKALEFRNFLTDYGRVKTVKILTDGKEYFGYLLMRTAEDAVKCRRLLNGKVWRHRKLVVQYETPGCRKDDDEGKKKEAVRDWKKEYDSAKEELTRVRTRLGAMEAEVKRLKRQASTERDLASLRRHLKVENSKLREEKEAFEKVKARLEADREVLSKGTVEMRGLREDINRKLDELKHHRGENTMNKSSPAMGEKRKRRFSEMKKYRHPASSFGGGKNGWPMQEQQQQNSWRFGVTGGGQQFSNEARFGPDGSYENFSSTSRETHFVNQQEFAAKHQSYFETRKY